MSDAHGRQVIFQMSPEDFSTEMLAWLTEQSVEVPDLGFLVQFRMAPPLAEQFTAAFPETRQFILE